MDQAGKHSGDSPLVSGMYRRFDLSTKEVYIVRRTPTRDGDKMTVIEKGVGLLKPAIPDDVKPGQVYYCKTGYAGTSFVETVFSSDVAWNDIVELCRCDQIYVRNPSYSTRRRAVKIK